MTESSSDKLENIDQERRSAIRKMVRVAAFTVPVVATFAIDGKISGIALAANTTFS